MATLRRNLVEKVKKAAAKVSSRGAEVATQAGTRGARAIVETTVAAVKTVDTIQKKLGRGKAAATAKAAAAKDAAATKAAAVTKAATAAKAATVAKAAAPKAAAAPVVNSPPASDAPVAKPPKRSAAPANLPEAPAIAGRDAGRKTMPAASAKRTKPAKVAAKGTQQVFKAKRGQKHIHTGR
ncbi:hypothetical protein [Stigmatella erecta]|uniref:Large subunit ribosomal protein L22e n=1 Tax=Stigmatella erecta TaxID=83460 RepID=A0A1I0KG32_9BACT|nr:hypothetical protein [Stigmatella erecta]SEU22782.1 large subunit ribosomal protein L22e [Stigmatella erecta]